MAAQVYEGNALRKSSAFRSRAVVVMIVLLLSTMLTLCCMMAAAPWAYGEIYPVDQKAAAQTYDAADNGEQAAQSSAEMIEGEQISDDAVPMASGLGSSEVMPVSTVGFQWAIIAGIVAVVAFFALSMRKTNSSIAKMRNMMR